MVRSWERAERLRSSMQIFNQLFSGRCTNALFAQALNCRIFAGIFKNPLHILLQQSRPSSQAGPREITNIESDSVTKNITDALLYNKGTPHLYLLICVWFSLAICGGASLLGEGRRVAYLT